MCSNLSNHPRLGVCLGLLLRSFPGFPYIYEDTRRYINIYNCVYMWCVLVYWWKNTNFLCPAEVTLYEVYVGREEVEQTFPSEFFPDCPPWWCPPQAVNTHGAPGEQEEAVKQVSYLQKAGRKFGTHLPCLKLNWVRNTTPRFCYSCIQF